MNYFLSVLKAVGNVVDQAVPFAHGARTKIAVVACPVLAYASQFGPAIPAPYNAVLPVLQTALCSAAPLFALAGLVRDVTDPSKK